MRRKSLKLNIDHEINFVLIGISSHENDYRLVWAINKSMKFNYIRTANLLVHHPKHDHEVEFSRFIYIDEERLITYYLIANRCPDGILFPDIKNIDFLVQIIGESGERSLKELLKALRNIEIISAAYFIKPEVIKDIARITPA